MEALILPSLIAATVGSFVWGIIHALTGGEGIRRRKLAQRLSNETRAEQVSAVARSITIQTEVTGLPEFVAQQAFIQRLHRRLIQAFPDTSLGRFLSLAGGIAVTVFLLVALISAALLPGLVAGVVAGYIPFFVVNTKRSRRQRRISLQIPEALDFLSRVLRAGHSLSTGLQMMGEELPQPLAGAFRRCYDQHSLGQALEDGLKDMASHIESTDFAFFVTAVLIQRQTGGDLSEVLQNISAMIRERIRLQQHVKAKTAEGRFTGYILVAFPAVMFFISYVLNPDYAGVLLHTNTGLMLLGSAFGLQMLGLYAIRKLTTVRV